MKYYKDSTTGEVYAYEPNQKVKDGLVAMSDTEVTEHLNPPKPEPTYVELRRAAYPDKGEQFDAIWKQLNYWRMNGQPLIQEADDMLSKVLKVKADFPKV